MSSVVISGDTSGAITLSAPAVAGTTTLTLPATTGTVLNDATCGVCRAWVNFNGTGTVAIRASFNVTSITDNGTGEYTVNFTTAMSDANYSVVYGSGEGTAGSGSRIAAQSGNTTTTQRIAIRNLSNTLVDAEQVNVGIFR